MKKHDVADEVAFTAEHMLGKEAVELGIDVSESPLRVEEIDNTAYDEPSANQQERDQDTATARPVLVRSTTTSSAPVNVVKIPIGERSGLLSRLSLLYEAEEPKHYPRNIKWWITFEIALAAVAAPMGSSIILRKHKLPASHLQFSDRNKPHSMTSRLNSIPRHSSPISQWLSTCCPCPSSRSGGRHSVRPQAGVRSTLLHSPSSLSGRSWLHSRVP